MKVNSSNGRDNTPSVERIIEVYPPDYVTLKNQVKDDSKKISDLQKRCRSLEHMLAFCDISPMDHIIHDYKSMSDFYLAQLTKEIAIPCSDYSICTVALGAATFISQTTGILIP